MTMPVDQDLAFMQLAYEQAKLAMEHLDIPVGAVVVKDNVVIGVGKNEREWKKLPTAHAELQAINAAAVAIGSWNLTGCTLYVTLEPCVMCSGALVLSRVKEVVYAAKDPKGGAESLQIPILNNAQLNHRLTVRQGPLATECGELLSGFFRELRKNKAPK